jgi:hypothetical protein
MRKSERQGRSSVWPRHNMLLIVTPNERGISYLICGCFGLGQLVQLSPANDERPKATVSAENSKRPVAPAKLITERAIGRNGKAAKMADRLRLRLALSEINDA